MKKDLTKSLLTCPLCASHRLYIYHKVSDCVRCVNCGYFNTLENWNTGLAKAWDNLMLVRIRFLERECNLNIIAKNVEDRRQEEF